MVAKPAAAFCIRMLECDADLRQVTRSHQWLARVAATQVRWPNVVAELVRDQMTCLCPVLPRLLARPAHRANKFVAGQV
jgi:hypothetical protein